MFQHFEDRSDRAATAARLAALRRVLRDQDLAGLLVPHADAHQSEYLPPSEERLAWLTGFTGSAGTAIVTATEAALFVDGRYTLQAEGQIDPAAFQVVHSAEVKPSDWLVARLAAGDRIGYDPWLLTFAETRRFERIAADRGAALVPLPENPIDRLWTDRPAPPAAPVSLHPIDLAGEVSEDKLLRLAAALSVRKADAAVLSEADSVAWTFNIRGADIAHSPAPLAFAMIRAGGRPTLYVEGRKLRSAEQTALAGLAEIAEPSSLIHDLTELGAAAARVSLDPETVPAAIAHAVANAGGTVVEGIDPAVPLKSRKNAAELAGARRAHRRDGLALVRFLAWLARTAPAGGLDEIAAVEALERFRTETAAEDGNPLVDIAFDTIAGAAGNAAIVHYRVTRATTRRLEPGTLFLVDSGAQYRDGTTDVTRTVAIGEPTAEMRDRFTRVLKGHIAIATARFPVGTSGAQLDVLARQALWQAGLDYDHGTGHGVGAFLSVHEGPARISKTGHAVLEPGMILSNEPGYYRAGAYGIRVENLVAITEPASVPGGERMMLGFETLTLAPIDLELVDCRLLSPGECAWLDAYHVRVRETLAPDLSADDRTWLEIATRPLG